MRILVDACCVHLTLGAGMLVLPFIVLTVVAMVLILAPLWQVRRPAHQLAPQRLNTRLFRERLNELEHERQQGQLDDDAYQALRAELERTLLNDVGALPTGHELRVRTGKLSWILGGSAALLPLLTLWYFYSYYYQGNVADWALTRERLAEAVAVQRQHPQQPPDKQLLDELPNTARVLQAQLSADGLRDAGGLQLLGAVYLELGAPQEASDALERALSLQPNNPEVMLMLAQGLIGLNEGKLEARSAQLLQTVLTQQPQHQGAKMLLGFSAAKAGEYTVALSALRSLRQDLAASPEALQLLDQGIAQIEQKQRPPAADTTTASAPAAEKRITLKVALSQALQDKLAANDQVLVFAKAESGPPMPLAAVRQPAQNFPLEVVLDDSQAMLDTLKLSQFERVQVQARIAKGNGPQAQAGDLQSAPLVVDLTATPNANLELTIDQVVQ